MLSNKGATLMELVVVVGISAIVVGALVFTTIASLRNAQFSKNQAQATKLAQEGIEWVRSGRDRNQCIKDLDGSVKSWNGSSGNSACPGSGAIWDLKVSSKCTDADLTPNCYFKINDKGELTYLLSAKDVPLSASESIPPTNAIFHRVIVISDDLNHDKNFTNDTSSNLQKEVTAIVTWTDISGAHESKLTTILRKL